MNILRKHPPPLQRGSLKIFTLLKEPETKSQLTKANQLSTDLSSRHPVYTMSLNQLLVTNCQLAYRLEKIPLRGQSE